MLRYKTPENEYGRGFTLIELMVAVSIFSLVMVMSAGAILAILDANYKSQTERSVMDNLNNALEDMTRSIRFGSHYHCGSSGDLTQTQDCASGNTAMAVLDSSGNTILYALSGGSITRSVNGGAALALTSPDITITSLAFRVFGSSVSDTLQPQAIVLIKGYVSGKNQTSSSFVLETTISQRNFDD